MSNIFEWAFDITGFPKRWECGMWAPAHGYVHIVSDLLIWLSYTAIPIVLGWIIWRRSNLPFPRIMWLFVIFILACGLTHLNEAIIFYVPIYRLQAITKVITALASVSTVFALFFAVPKVLSMPGLRDMAEELETVKRGRMEAAEKLRITEGRLAAALAAGGLGTWHWDFQTDLATLDSQACRLFGLPPTATTSSVQFFFDRIQADDLVPLLDEIRKVREEERDYAAEYRVIWPDGSTHWISANGALMRDSSGAVTGMTGTLVDQTSRIKAAETSARLAAIVASSPDAIVTQSLDRRVLSWNDGAERMYGYRAEEIIGMSMATIVPQDRLDEVDAYQKLAFESGAVWDVESERKRKDGRIINVSVSLATIRDRHDRITGVSTIERDISDRVRATAELEAANKQLWEQNEEMELFTYTVSHDLKSPLVTIQGFLGILEEELPDGASEDARGAMRRIDQAARRMTSLIEDLLRFSRVGRLEYKHVDVELNPLIADVVEAIDPDERPGFEIQPLPVVKGDVDRLRQVFENLIGNAVKYGAPKAGEARVVIGAEAADDEHRIFIRDNGPGIPPQHHERIFRLFERLDGSSGGTGIGLALVARVVSRHGGRVWLESVPGQGATFWLALPKGVTDSDQET